MKNHMNRVLALLVALLVLCAPIGAMAEQTSGISEIGATVALSNFALSMGEDANFNIDVTAQLDLAADLQNGNFSGTLTALAAKDKALKAGFNFDMATMNLTAGLEGMPDAVLVPMADLFAQLQAQMNGQFSEDDMAKIMNMINAYTNLVTVASQKGEVIGAALQDTITAIMARAITDVGDTTITVEEQELPAHQYDVVITAQDMAEIASVSAHAMMDDPELLAALQQYVDAIVALSGEESIDISSLDIDAAMAQLAETNMNIGGSLYIIDEQSFVFDIAVEAAEGDETMTIPMEIIVLTDEESSYASFTIDASTEEGGTAVITIEADIPVDGTPKFSFVVTGTQESESNGQDIMISLEGDFTNGVSVTFFAQDTATYTYGENTYNSLNAFGLSYNGTVESGEAGVSCPGTLVLYVNSDGQEMTFSADTLVALNAASTVDFDMPNNLIDITKADEETMNALSEEAMTVLQQGLMILMGAPGMENLMPMIQG